MAPNIEKIMMPVPHVAYGSERLPLRIGAMELPCFILSDNRIVFSKTGLQKALGYDGRSGDWLFDLLGSINKFFPIPGDLFDALEHAIPFEISRADGSNYIEMGLSAETVLSACKMIVNAKDEGYLSVGQLKHAKTAANISKFFSENQIEQAVAEATGLNFAKDSGKDFLWQYLLQNNDDILYLWVPALRDALYEELFKMHDMGWSDLRKNPKKAAELLQEIVFSRLTDHLLSVLRTNKPKRSYRRKGQQPQDGEHPELRTYITEVLSLLKAAGENWTIFIQLLNRIHPKTNMTVLTLPELPDNQPSGALDQQLKKALELNNIYKKK